MGWETGNAVLFIGAAAIMAFLAIKIENKYVKLSLVIIAMAFLLTGFSTNRYAINANNSTLTEAEYGNLTMQNNLVMSYLIMPIVSIIAFLMLIMFIVDLLFNLKANAKKPKVKI